MSTPTTTQLIARLNTVTVEEAMQQFTALPMWAQHLITTLRHNLESERLERLAADPNTADVVNKDLLPQVRTRTMIYREIERTKDALKASMDETKKEIALYGRDSREGERVSVRRGLRRSIVQLRAEWDAAKNS